MGIGLTLTVLDIAPVDNLHLSLGDELLQHLVEGFLPVVVIVVDDDMVEALFKVVLNELLCVAVLQATDGTESNLVGRGSLPFVGTPQSRIIHQPTGMILWRLVFP